MFADFSGGDNGGFEDDAEKLEENGCSDFDNEAARDSAAKAKTPPKKSSTSRAKRSVATSTAKPKAKKATTRRKRRITGWSHKKKGSVASSERVTNEMMAQMNAELGLPRASPSVPKANKRRRTSRKASNSKESAAENGKKFILCSCLEIRK